MKKIIFALLLFSSRFLTAEYFYFEKNIKIQNKNINEKALNLIGFNPEMPDSNFKDGVKSKDLKESGQKEGTGSSGQSENGKPEKEKREKGSIKTKNELPIFTNSKLKKDGEENPDGKAEDSKSEAESEKSAFEQKKEIIEYGLQEEIIELIKTLKEEKDERFNEILVLVFKNTKSPEVRSAIFDFFAHIKNTVLKETAEKIIKDNYEYKDSEVRSAISYLSENGIKESAAVLREIIKDENSSLLETAIAAAGKLGGAEDAVFLAEYYKNAAFEDEKKALIVRQNIMKAMEELSCEECRAFLLEIAEDENENSIVRASAAAAIGKLGDEEAFKVLAKLYEDSDPILRTAAVKGVSSFQNEAAAELLLQGCKDPYYKVRLQAIQSARESKNPKAIPFVLYRAKKDPENAVRFAAAEALSEFGNEESDLWLLETFNSEKSGMSLRVKIAESLLKNKFELIYPDFKKTVLETLTDEKNKTLRYELGKALAKIENTQTAEIAKAFLLHKDVLTKSIGLDMFKKNRYAELISLVREISGDSKNGALQKRAKTLLEEAAPEA